MIKSNEYHKSKELLSGIADIDFSPQNGEKFKYPVYMTERLSNTGIDALELGVRSYNCLRRAGINTIGELCERVEKYGDLHTIRNCGKTSVAEIMDNLFVYHFMQLNSERRGRYIEDVLSINR